MPAALPLLLVLAALALIPARAPAQIMGFEPADPDAPPVTEENLLESERFWPYRVEITRPWPPAGEGRQLPAGSRGVLVRVDPPGVARIDFGSDGRFEVPVGETDLVERANQVRLGQHYKLAPNFVHAIGPRLVDAAFPAPRNVPIEAVLRPPGFLAVFAAPEDFADLAEALGPLHGRHGVWTVLFPQDQQVGYSNDPALRRQLRELGWLVPFVYTAMSAGYTRSRLADGTPIPAVMLQTPEGRVLFQSAWRPDVLPELIAALDAAFGKPGETLAGAAVSPSP